jgi:hypothetical protein
MLSVIQEEPYKRGGRVGKAKKPKKAKKTRKATGKRKKTRTKRSMREAMRYLPVGGAMPTTGMGSVVFGAPQTPSYFRASAPDVQTFASLPGGVKSIQEGQTKTLKMLEMFDERGRRQEEFNREVVEQFGLPMPVKKASKATVSVMSTPKASPPDSPVDWVREGFRPITASPIQTLDTLQIKVPSLPSTPIRPSPVPVRIISPSYEGPLSSAEASQPYRGADESLPVQAPTSGDDMKPLDAVFDSPDSTFVPLTASAPESVGDAVDRASQVAASASSHVPFIKKKFYVKAPVLEKPLPVEPPLEAPKVKPLWSIRNPDTITSRDDLNSIASALGISNPKKEYVGIGSTARLREAIKEAQANR